TIGRINSNSFDDDDDEEKTNSFDNDKEDEQTNSFDDDDDNYNNSNSNSNSFDDDDDDAITTNNINNVKIIKPQSVSPKQQSEKDSWSTDESSSWSSLSKNQSNVKVIRNNNNDNAKAIKVIKKIDNSSSNSVVSIEEVEDFSVNGESNEVSVIRDNISKDKKSRNSFDDDDNNDKGSGESEWDSGESEPTIKADSRPEFRKNNLFDNFNDNKNRLSKGKSNDNDVDEEEIEVSFDDDEEESYWDSKSDQTNEGSRPKIKVITNNLFKENNMKNKNKNNSEILSISSSQSISTLSSRNGEEEELSEEDEEEENIKNTYESNSSSSEEEEEEEEEEEKSSYGNISEEENENKIKSQSKKQARKNKNELSEDEQEEEEEDDDDESENENDNYEKESLESMNNGGDNDDYDRSRNRKVKYDEDEDTHNNRSINEYSSEEEKEEREKEEIKKNEENVEKNQTKKKNAFSFLKFGNQKSNSNENCSAARTIIKYREASIKELKTIDSNFMVEADEELIISKNIYNKFILNNNCDLKERYITSLFNEKQKQLWNIVIGHFVNVIYLSDACVYDISNVIGWNLIPLSSLSLNDIGLSDDIKSILFNIGNNLQAIKHLKNLLFSYHPVIIAYLFQSQKSDYYKMSEMLINFYHAFTKQSIISKKFEMEILRFYLKYQSIEWVNDVIIKIKDKLIQYNNKLNTEVSDKSQLKKNISNVKDILKTIFTMVLSLYESPKTSLGFKYICQQIVMKHTAEYMLELVVNQMLAEELIEWQQDKSQWTSTLTRDTKKIFLEIIDLMKNFVKGKRDGYKEWFNEILIKDRPNLMQQIEIQYGKGIKTPEQIQQDQGQRQGLSIISEDVALTSNKSNALMSKEFNSYTNTSQIKEDIMFKRKELAIKQLINYLKINNQILTKDIVAISSAKNVKQYPPWLFYKINKISLFVERTLRERISKIEN
ncbi:hypothetical protein U3516DRAFT_534519, partial [Neocallimastix sp. 'constans']